VATAPTVVLDPSGLNINLNAQGSSTGIFFQEANDVANVADWGGQAVQDFINTGAFRIEDVDGVLAANRVVRTIILPIRVIGSSKDNLNTTLSNLNFALAKASRFQPLDLVVTPGGSTKTTTYKVIGGDTLAYYTQTEDLANRWIGQLTLVALPIGYGAKQTYGTSGSPLFAAAAGPGSFTVTIPAGSEGDLLADVTVIFQLTADTVGAVTVGCISGNSSWTVTSDITSWSAGSGGGTRAAQSNAKYKGGAAPGYITAVQGATEEAYTKTFTTSDFPTGTPIRCILLADDFQVLAARRGFYQIRLAVAAGGVTSYGDWVSVPAAAGNGTTTHFLQALDMGAFLFPPGPSGSVAFSGSTTVSIQVQDANLHANALTCAFDSMIFLPDASSLIAEWPVSQPAANTPIRIESDLLFNNADGAPQTVLMSGAHVRSRGTTRYSIWASSQALANTSGDVSYSLVKAWVEVVPRYVGLAPV
jgi:hypothetical protein